MFLYFLLRNTDGDDKRLIIRPTPSISGNSFTEDFCLSVSKLRTEKKSDHHSDPYKECTDQTYQSFSYGRDVPQSEGVRSTRCTS